MSVKSKRTEGGTLLFLLQVASRYARSACSRPRPFAEHNGLTQVSSCPACAYPPNKHSTAFDRLFRGALELVDDVMRHRTLQLLLCASMIEREDRALYFACLIKVRSHPRAEWWWRRASAVAPPPPSPPPTHTKKRHTHTHMPSIV